ncbi:hypothetical protein O181_061626 [Austropuccinia psidii MF-1]|uniref:Uncharacterized protein n=1 Tax=Austropuccinia psidii MF-1 TaxID=1389203 RepID=A0A9Q3EGG5_9BASI|nr:hypothetical protein [Austropuccinia psidii MF-1]
MVQDPFGAEFITQDLPCNFGEARILMVLEPLNGSRPRATFLSHGTPGSPDKLVPGASNSPHQAYDPKNTKWPKKAINSLNQKIHPRPRKGQKGHKFTLHRESP